MKVVRVLTGAVLLITVPVIIESCGYGCGFGRDHNGPKSFSIADSFEISYSSRTRIPGKDNYDIKPLASGNSPVLTFLIGVTLEVETRTAAVHRPTMGAYACSPEPVLCEQKFAQITVTSDRRLTTTKGAFAAGESLNSIFLGAVNPSNSIDYPIEGLHSEALEVNIFGLVFDKNQDVDVAQKHKFKITIKLDDGRTLEATGAEIELTPKI